MDVRDLKYFSAVVRNRHFRRAAKELEITQPAISKAVQRLERNLGTMLLQRTVKGAAPTQAGVALMRRIRQIEEAIETTQREIGDLASGSAGHVRIGAGATMLAQMLPQTCAKLLKSLPGVTLKVVGDMNDNLFKALRNGELDLVVSGLPENVPGDLVQEPLMRDELCIVTNAAHPITKARNCSLSELTQLRWALPPRPVFSRELLDRSFQEHNLPAPTVAIESNSAQMLLETVARSDLATFQPIRNVRGVSHLKLHVLRVKHIRWHRRIGISYRRDAYLPPAARKAITLLREDSSR